MLLAIRSDFLCTFVIGCKDMKTDLEMIVYGYANGNLTELFPSPVNRKTIAVDQTYFGLN